MSTAFADSNSRPTNQQAQEAPLSRHTAAICIVWTTIKLYKALWLTARPHGRAAAEFKNLVIVAFNAFAVIMLPDHSLCACKSCKYRDCSGLPGSGLAGGAADAGNQVTQADIGRQTRVLQLFIRHRRRFVSRQPARTPAISLGACVHVQPKPHADTTRTAAFTVNACIRQFCSAACPPDNEL